MISESCWIVDKYSCTGSSSSTSTSQGDKISTEPTQTDDCKGLEGTEQEAKEVSQGAQAGEDNPKQEEEGDEDEDENEAEEYAINFPRLFSRIQRSRVEAGATSSHNKRNPFKENSVERLATKARKTEKGGVLGGPENRECGRLLEEEREEAA